MKVPSKSLTLPSFDNALIIYQSEFPQLPPQCVAELSALILCHIKSCCSGLMPNQTQHQKNLLLQPTSSDINNCTKCKELEKQVSNVCSI